MQICDRSFAELDAATLYGLVKLRVDVFVVEQHCPYPELDGRDTEPGTRHLWIADGEPLAYLRVLTEADATAARIGRVCTAASARGRGLAGTLMTATLERLGGRTVVLDAQSYLQRWYERYGFAADGPEFVEDGIPHVPMRRPAS